MAISSCVVTVNSKGEETKQHGNAQFPIACYEDNVSDEPVPWHWHEDLEIIWVISGSIKVCIDTAEKIVNKNQGIFINAGLLHEVQANSEEKCVLQSIVFHPRLIGGIDSIYWQNYIEPILQNKKLPYIFLELSADWKNRALKLSESVWNRLINEEYGYEIYARNELSEIILLASSNQLMCESKTNVKNTRNAERIKTMLQYIHSHFSEDITISHLSNEANISPSEVLRCFHHTIHTTPNQYLKQYRIQKATKMLAETDMTSLEIAFECGFQSSSYFTKTFKEKIGSTPLEFRKKYLKI